MFEDKKNVYIYRERDRKSEFSVIHRRHSMITFKVKYGLSMCRLNIISKTSLSRKVSVYQPEMCHDIIC